MLSKKIIAPISLSLSLLLISPSILKATELGDILMSTSTSAGTWSDPLGGGTYLYGGDFKMKFKSTSSVAPLVQFKLPSAKIGCSGISLDGGFLAFLGLDKLQDQLADAGSSLMFGIILGMEFTLPAVSAVFAKVRAWANALQAMLQNGCNIGRSISAGSAAAKSLREGMLDSNINAPFNELNDFISGGDNALKSIQKLANCSGSTTDPNCALEKLAQEAMGKGIQEDKKSGQSASTGGTQGLTEKGTPFGTKSQAIVTTIDLSKFYTDKKIICPGITSTSISADDVLIDILKYVFFGEIGSDSYALRDIESKIDVTNCKYNYASLSKDLENSTTSGAPSSFPTPVYSKISPLISNPEDAAQMLVYGLEKLNEKYTSITNNTITIPNRKIVYLDAPIGVDANGDSTSRERAVYVSAIPSASTTPITLSWAGAFKESLKGIRAIVDTQTGQSWTLAASYGEYDTSGIAAISTPLLVPGVKKYANIIAKLEKKNNGATPQTEQLKVKLAKYNAIVFSEGLINGIQAQVGKLVTGIKGNPTIVNDYLKSIDELEKHVSILLKEMKKDLSSDELIETFKTLEKEQTLEAVKAER